MIAIALDWVYESDNHTSMAIASRNGKPIANEARLLRHHTCAGAARQARSLGLHVPRFSDCAKVECTAGKRRRHPDFVRKDEVSQILEGVDWPRPAIARVLVALERPALEILRRPLQRRQPDTLFATSAQESNHFHSNTRSE
jgi:hypothetical protein